MLRGDEQEVTAATVKAFLTRGRSRLPPPAELFLSRSLSPYAYSRYCRVSLVLSCLQGVLFRVEFVLLPLKVVFHVNTHRVIWSVFTSRCLNF